MKLIASGVTCSAAMHRSPSFSRSGESTTTTMRPARISAIASSTVANVEASMLGICLQIFGSDRHDGCFDGISAAAPTSFSTYLPTRSASRFTRAPGSSRPSVVTARVCGMSATENASSSQAGHRQADAGDAHRPLLDRVAEHGLRAPRTSRARRRRRARPPSPCPRRRRAPAPSGRPAGRPCAWRARRSPGRRPRRSPSVVRRSVSATASNSSTPSPIATAVRQQPSIDTESPIRHSAAVAGGGQPQARARGGGRDRLDRADLADDAGEHALLGLPKLGHGQDIRAG